MKNIAPSADLARWVSSYNLMEFDAPIVAVPGIAVFRHAILISYGDPVRIHFGDETIDVPEIGLRGAVSRPWVIQFQRSVCFIAVDLHTATLHHLIRDSVSALTNQEAEMCDFGFRVDNALMDGLRHPNAGITEKIASVENYLRPIFARIHERDPVRPGLLVNLEALRHTPYADGCFDYTERHLRREFVRHLGISPQQYRDIARVKQACGHLVSPSRFSITRIAQELGFHDAAHFNRAFKRYTALTPTQYRAQADANPLDAMNHT